MTDFISHEWNLFLVSLIYGVLIGFLFDCFRLIRYAIKTGTIVCAFEDFIFWIFSSFLICDLLYRFHDGAVRFYAFLGLILGFIIYHFSVSVFFLHYMKKLIDIVKKGLVHLKKTGKKIFLRFVEFAKKCIEKRKKALK